MLKYLFPLLLCGSAVAQTTVNPPVFQSGTVTPTHNACWTTDGVIEDCGPGQPVPVPFPLGTLPILSATAFGVKANGVTSDDLALKSAVDACALIGAKLVLPPGKILLTGLATINLQDCGLVGSGVPGATQGVNGSNGTMIVLTSTTTKPFIAGKNWSITGVNFFWPGQTNGTTVYPALLNCDVSCVHWSFTNNVLINPYDFFVDTPGAGVGSFQVNDNWLWAAHDLFRSAGQGDAISVSNNQMTPGNWLNITGSSIATKTAIDNAAANNSIFHLTAKIGAAWNLTAKGNRAFAWRYGFKLDSGAVIGISNVDMIWDGVQSLIDSSASGTNWAGGNVFTGTLSSCSGVDYVGGTTPGNAPCFNLGAVGEYNINGLNGELSNGTFIQTSGASVSFKGSSIGRVGNIADGGEYYAINYTANAGTIIEVKGSQLSGQNGSTHVHGIGSSTAATASRLIIENSNFLFFNDDVTVIAAPTTIITGNWSINTQGASSVTITGTNGVIYSGNNWDKPPLATMGACGTNPASHGGFSGFFTTGTGGTTSCAFTLPWVPYGPGGGVCTAMLGNTPTVYGNPSGSPPTWTFIFSAPYNGGNVFYNCPGQQ